MMKKLDTEVENYLPPEIPTEIHFSLHFQAGLVPVVNDCSLCGLLSKKRCNGKSTGTGGGLWEEEADVFIGEIQLFPRG